MPSSSLADLASGTLMSISSLQHFRVYSYLQSKHLFHRHYPTANPLRNVCGFEQLAITTPAKCRAQTRKYTSQDWMITRNTDQCIHSMDLRLAHARRQLLKHYVKNA